MERGSSKARRNQSRHSHPARSLGVQTVNEAEDFLLEVRQGYFMSGEVQIVDMPVFHAIRPGGELLQEQGAVLSFLHRHDQVRTEQIAFGHLRRKAKRLVRRDAEDFHYLQRQHRQGTDVLATPTDRQPSRIRSPAQAFFGCNGIEEDLGKPAAVIVAGAEKQDRVFPDLRQFPTSPVSLSAICSGGFYKPAGDFFQGSGRTVRGRCRHENPESLVPVQLVLLRLGSPSWLARRVQ
jgi:hypothetical protein